jgi:outer membrane protein assembly factor BamE
MTVHWLFKRRGRFEPCRYNESSYRHTQTMLEKYRCSAWSALKICAMAAAACALAACSSTSGGSANPVNWITPYKVDVIQGNFVSKEQVEALKVGMTRGEVKDLLGTPLLASLFHADRWDYVFTLKRQGVESQSYKYTTFFKGDVLERFEGDAMPTEAEFILALASARSPRKVPVLDATPEQLKAAEKPSASAAPASTSNTPAAATTGAQPVTYPPLESAKP